MNIDFFIFSPKKWRLIKKIHQFVGYFFFDSIPGIYEIIVVCLDTYKQCRLSALYIHVEM